MESSKVLEILNQHVGKNIDVKLSSNLVTDLYIDGDDADELFEALMKIHPLDLSSKELSKYFHSEGELLDLLLAPFLEKEPKKVANCTLPMRQALYAADGKVQCINNVLSKVHDRSNRFF